MLDFDASRLPTGSLGWAALFTAVEAAAPEDENQWLEFKAGVDPSTPEGAATLAKAVVAFANRRVDVAEKWLGGHALILVGIEPGDLHGAVSLDPAVLHDRVGRLLADPAPVWDCAYHDYKGKRVLVITVAPPKQGDPIHCIGKSSASVEDGHVYVRRIGKSDRAKSDDIRALSARLQSPAQGLDLQVSATTDGGIRRCIWSDDWLDRWVDAERAQLLTPMEKDLKPGIRLSLSTANALRALQQLEDTSDQVTRAISDPEDRTPDQFRQEVENYLTVCRERLQDAPSLAAARALNPTTWTITNLTDHNLEDIQVKVHVDGDVEAFENTAYFGLADLTPTAPRTWGPRLKSAVRPQLLHGQPTRPEPREFTTTPKPIVTNGGSASIDFPPVTLRPRGAAPLDDGHVLVLAPNFTGPVRCTWTATATNLSGVAEGEFTIAVDGTDLDIDGLLQHRPDLPRRRTVRPQSDGWTSPETTRS